MMSKLFFFAIFFTQYIIAHGVSSYFPEEALLSASWESNGTTVAGGHGKGSETNQLDSPYGIVVDKNDVLFVADYSNDRVMRWEESKTSGDLYARGRCSPSNIDNLCSPSAITSSKDGTLYVTVQSDTRGGVITVKNGVISTTPIIIADTSFYGIALDDKEEYLYVGHHREHSVVKYKIDGTPMGIVAGGHDRGPALNQLDYPRGVAVDKDGSVYVSDSNNHRIMKWTVNARQGIIVGGGNGNGSGLNQLNIPAGLYRTKDGDLFVADERNHRVLLIDVPKKTGTIVVGGYGPGSSSDKLDAPIYISFNNGGDLYVTDSNNFRVQKFAKRNATSSNCIYAHPNKWLLIIAVSIFIGSITAKREFD